jgi:hypothetical protein
MNILDLHFEPINTPQGLVDFWLFAIEQGWPHPEMRRQIAEMTMYVSSQAKIRSSDELKRAEHEVFERWVIHATTSDLSYMGSNNKEIKEFYDSLWRILKEDVEEFKDLL